MELPAMLSIALVVAVVVLVLAIGDGFRSTLRATGRADNALLVQRGSVSEFTSWVPFDIQRIVDVDNRVARAGDGELLASPELVIVTSLRRADGVPTNVTVRGVTRHAFDVRGGVRVIAGRPFQASAYELIVGQRIASRTGRLDLGTVVPMQRQEWHVVGIFASDGAFDSEMWGDFDQVASTFKRTGGANTVALRLADTAAL